MEEQGTKKPWLSKTLLVNALFAIGLLFSLDEKIGLSKDMLMSAMIFLNMLLRMITKDKIVLRE